MKIYNNPNEAFFGSINELKNLGSGVQNPRWQGIDTSQIKEASLMKEILFLNFQVLIPDTKKNLQKNLEIKDQDWAEIHFKERVCGSPLNPPPSYIQWQNGKSSDYMQKENQVFSHSYPERFWFGEAKSDGLRFENGTLEDIVTILKDNPDTRQAFLPMFLFEDLTAAKQGERVPCSLGWHFIQRKGFFHLMYTLRSCDAVRHFKNDLYMSMRLAQWVRDKVNKDFKMGIMTMVISSFHCFQNDLYTLDKMCKSS